MDWYFYSQDRRGQVTVTELSNRDRATAFAIARSFGWRPSVWYNPWTWANYVIMG